MATTKPKQGKDGKGEGKQKKSFAVLCTPDRLTRNNYYSDTYTAVMTVNGEKRAMDITHISLPFRAQREKAVMKYFDISKAGMQELYSQMGSLISNQVNMCTRLNRKDVGSILQFISREVVDKSGGKKDIYLVTEHLRPLVDVYFYEKTTLRTIFNFATRACVLLRDIHEKTGAEQMNLRVLDPEQIFVDDKGMFVFGSFQYSYMEGYSKSVIPTTETAPLHINGKVQTGDPGNIGTDMHTLASLLWSLLNGDGFDRPTPTGTPPKYATPEMVKALELGMDGDPEMFAQFRKQISNIYRELNKSPAGDEEVPVPVVPRCVDAELVSLDIAEMEMEPAKEEAPAPTTPAEVVAPKPEREVEVPPKAEPTPAVPEVNVTPELETSEPAQVVEEPVIEEITPPEPVEYIAPAKVIVADTTQFVAENESARDIETLDEDYSDIQISYNKPIFFVRQLLMALFLTAVVMFVAYMSVKTHLISFW